MTQPSNTNHKINDASKTSCVGLYCPVDPSVPTIKFPWVRIPTEHNIYCDFFGFQPSFLIYLSLNFEKNTNKMRPRLASKQSFKKIFDLYPAYLCSKPHRRQDSNLLLCHLAGTINYSLFILRKNSATLLNSFSHKLLKSGQICVKAWMLSVGKLYLPDTHKSQRTI